MKVSQLIKQLNNTELGKGGTHDTYVLIPNELDISDIFSEVNLPIEFIDVDTSEKVTVRNTVGREKRLVGLGQYYRSKDLSAGDEIIFEKDVSEKDFKYIIRTIRHRERIAFQKSKMGFEILTSDRMKMAESWENHFNGLFEIKFLTEAKKRNDSPDTTRYYDIVIDGSSILEDFSVKEIGFLKMENGSIKVMKWYGWKKYVFEMEG